jgi:hypothetical protein
MYLIGGIRNDDSPMHAFQIAPAHSLEDVKQSFGQVTSIHVYSVSSAAPKDSEVVAAADSLASEVHFNQLRCSTDEVKTWSAVRLDGVTARAAQQPIAEPRSVPSVSARQPKVVNSIPAKSESKQSNSTSKPKSSKDGSAIANMFNKAPPPKPKQSAPAPTKAKCERQPEPEAEQPERSAARRRRVIEDDDDENDAPALTELDTSSPEQKGKQQSEKADAGSVEHQGQQQFETVDTPDRSSQELVQENIKDVSQSPPHKSPSKPDMTLGPARALEQQHGYTTNGATKRRKVTREEEYEDEKGYTHIRTVEEWEDVPAEEIEAEEARQEALRRKQQSRSEQPNHGKEKPFAPVVMEKKEPVAAKKKKTGAAPQKGIMSFFGKK